MTGNQHADNTPWKSRFRTSTAVMTAIAKAAPARGIATSNISGTFQIHAWDVPSGEMKQITRSPTGKIFAWISSDGRWIYYLNDEKGNEIGHLVRVPYDGGEFEDITPELPPYTCFDFSVSPNGSRIAYTVADQSGITSYSQDLDSAGDLRKPQRIFHSAKVIRGPVLSYDGTIAVVASAEQSSVQDYELRAFDLESGKQLCELWDGDGSSLVHLRFSPAAGDTRLVGTASKSGSVRPILWNPRTGERVDITLPNLEGDVMPVDWSPDGQTLLLLRYNRAEQQLYAINLEKEELTKLNHPRGTYGIRLGLGCYFASNSEIFAQWQDSTHPSQLISLNSTTGKKEKTVLPASDVPEGHPWRSVSFDSSDGQSIQAWIGTPDGAGPFPTILHTHGGPEAVVTDEFNPSAQAWIDHGFAFVTVNFRGSTTFGRDFQAKIWGNPGHWEIEDLAAAREWLVSQGIADPKRILLTGTSYGGFNTLMGLGKKPELWAGGMANVTVADWAMMYEDANDALKSYIAALFGGPPSEKKEQYRKSSPISYAEHIQAPILVMQGRNDTRTPARQLEAFEARLKELGKSIEVHWFDAGHIRGSVDADIERQEMMLAFANKVVEGLDQ